MHIVFVTGNYPAPTRPFEGTFVQQFVWAMARQGNDCTVIKPTSVFARGSGPYPPKRSKEQTGDGKSVQVLRPRYLSFSSKGLGWTHTGRWTQWSFERIAGKAVSQLSCPPDAVYGHFLYHAGKASVTLGRKFGVPSFVGVGEGTFWTVEPFGFKQAQKDLANATGFLANASHIRDGLVTQIGVPEEKIIVIPNGVDLSRFFPSDQKSARKQLGLNPDLFIVAFVGAFDDLKGGRELTCAVEDLDKIGLVLIGKGQERFRSNKIVHIGPVSHELIPLWLNASDIFVLPTREEGSCNAVIEALACGLPIVTSNGNYMDDIVDAAVAIRVDPTDVQGIREAIRVLRDEPERRRRMSMACLAKAKQFDINERARRVTEWMAELVRHYPYPSQRVSSHSGLAIG